MSGWIKLHRKLLENPIVCKDSDHLAVWTYLLLNATHKEYTVVFAGEKIQLQPGQLITGRKAISEKFNISESKVQRILKSFEIDRQIEQQTSNKNRIISILSWSDYQEDEQQNEQPVNNKRTSTEQQVNTNKNVKNLKNKRIKELKDIGQSDDGPSAPRFIPPTIEQVKEYCQERKNKVDPQKWIDYYTSNGWKVGKNAMKDWKAAVRTWERSEYGKGNTANGKSSKTSGKPQIPTVQSSSSDPISDEELREIQELARKLDGG